MIFPKYRGILILNFLEYKLDETKLNSFSKSIECIILGRTFKAKYNYNLAKAYFELSLKYGSVIAYEDLIDLYTEVGEKEIATDFKILLEKNRNLIFESDLLEHKLYNGQNKCGVEYSALGNTYRLNNNNTLGEKYLKLGVKYGFTVCNNDLGLLYESMKKYNLAEECYLKSANIGYVDSFNNLGLLYEEIGKYDLSKRYYKMAADKGDSNAQYNLGFLYLKNNEIEEAKKYLEEAKKSGDADADALLKKLLYFSL